MKKTGTTITVLADNTSQGIGLIGQHGLGLWVGTFECCLLFDTSHGLALPQNVVTLNFDPDGSPASCGVAKCDAEVIRPGRLHAASGETSRLKVYDSQYHAKTTFGRFWHPLTTNPPRLAAFPPPFCPQR